MGFLLAALCGCGGVGNQNQGQPMPTSTHVVMVMEENQTYSTVVGKTKDWPNYNNLLAKSALATNYYANEHGSISEYFMLTTGQILTDNDGSTQVFNVDNIARSMLAAKVPFRVYAEGITRGYLGGDTGLYVIRHDPFAMLSDVADSQSVAGSVLWPFPQFLTDAAGGKLPEFSFIVPNIDDDAHTGTPQQADAWLQKNVVTPLTQNKAFQAGGDGILIVLFDEAALSDTSHGGGQVAALFWGPLVKPGYRQTSKILYQHQSMLRSVMDALSLSNPPGAAASAPTMGEFFQQPPAKTTGP